MGRPDPLVRNVPADDEAVVMTVAPDALAPPLAGALLGADAPAGVLDAAGLLVLPALEHAAASSATPTAPPTPVASLAGADIRLMDFLIVFVSCLARPSRASPTPPNDCRYR